MNRRSSHPVLALRAVAGAVVLAAILALPGVMSFAQSAVTVVIGAVTSLVDTSWAALANVAEALSSVVFSRSTSMAPVALGIVVGLSWLGRQLLMLQLSPSAPLERVTFLRKTHLVATALVGFFLFVQSGSLLQISASSPAYLLLLALAVVLTSRAVAVVVVSTSPELFIVALTILGLPILLGLHPLGASGFSTGELTLGAALYVVGGLVGAWSAFVTEDQITEAHIQTALTKAPDPLQMEQ